MQENILFEAPFHADDYDRALTAAGLHTDLEQLPAGDQTELGEGVRPYSMPCLPPPPAHPASRTYAPSLSHPHPYLLWPHCVGRLPRSTDISVSVLVLNTSAAMLSCCRCQ